MNHHRKKRKQKSNKNEKHNFGFVTNYAGKQKSNGMKYMEFFNIMVIRNFKGPSLENKICRKCKVNRGK